MSLTIIPINSGTGPNVAVDIIGTANYQVVKIMQATDGSTGSLTPVLAVTNTGTSNVLITNVLSATGVIVAQVTTLLGTATVTALLAATTGTIGSVVATAHASRFQAFVLATTSAAGGVIVKTSGANTLYITDALVSVSGPMNILLCSETTTLAGPVYLATNGGFAMNYVQPLVCTTAQSLRVILSSSGSCSVNVCGYTVT